MLKIAAVDKGRIRKLNELEITDGPIVYWVSRDQRVRDNWALLYAQQLAAQKKQPLVVVFCLMPTFLGATLRQYDFMLKGLQEVEKQLRAYNIPLQLLLGAPEETLVDFARSEKVGAIVSDFDPLKIKKEWKETVGGKIGCAFFEVDAHNIVPCWEASPKQEFGAYTLRPKINRILEGWLAEFPKMRKQEVKNGRNYPRIDWDATYLALSVDRSVAPVEWIIPGEKAARRKLKQFLEEGLSDYASKRNDPNAHGQSDLSPYLHFGHLSAQRVALDVRHSEADAISKEAFLEELIVRRELADNFCFYNQDYDAFSGFPEWAKKSLNEHRSDPREYLYVKKQFEQARTHDELWNAAQLEMVHGGKMHGYMRMYWAKKILEWTDSPEEALEIAIFLNDKYSLDGRDPNGYAGIAWSIGGVHDRAWFGRAIFGKIRYMSYGGCRTKFDVRAYCEKDKQS